MLKIGLLMNSLQIAAWQHSMLHQIRIADYATIALVILNHGVATPNGGLQRSLPTLWNRRQHLLYKLYSRVDDRLFRPQPDAFAVVDASKLVVGVPTVRVTPRQGKYTDIIGDEDLEAIKSHDIDVLIRLGFRILKGGILKAARYGVWSYHHGDNRVNRGGPPGFWEVLEAWPVTGSILQVLTEDLDNGLVLYRSYSATDRISVKRNRNGYYWKTAAFIPRLLKRLHDEGEKKFFDEVRPMNEHPDVYSSRLYRAPSNGQALGLFARHALRCAKLKTLEKLSIEQWILMFDFSDGIAGSLHRFKKIIPPRDRFWADPHIVYRDHRYYVFLEEYPYQTRKGYIAVLTMDEQGHWERPVNVLERPYHLSYPFVFQWNDDFYMIPETASNRTIEVYRSIEFPWRWELHKVIMDNVSAVDATLFHHGTGWWLFAGIREHEGASSCDELSVFFADNPLSTEWRSHPRNPVISDIRSARPAGRLFRHRNSIYRPSQYLYGAGIKLNKVTALTERDYAEEEVGSLSSAWDDSITGLHTLSHEHRLTVIDARLRRFRPVID
jgi:hypothetical protein